MRDNPYRGPGAASKSLHIHNNIPGPRTWNRNACGRPPDQAAIVAMFTPGAITLIVRAIQEPYIGCTSGQSYFYNIPTLLMSELVVIVLHTFAFPLCDLQTPASIISSQSSLPFSFRVWGPHQPLPTVRIRDSGYLRLTVTHPPIRLSSPCRQTVHRSRKG